MRFYYIATSSRWLLVQAKNQRIARKAATQENGRGMTVECRLATDTEIAGYCSHMGFVDASQIEVAE